MAYALVGAVGAVSTGTAGAAVTPVYGAGANRTANNQLILTVLTTGSAVLPATPSGWLVAKQQAGTSCSASIFYRVATGSDAAPTVAAVTGAIHNARLSEFSGGITSTPLDQTAGNNGSATPLVATTGAADVGAGDLVIGCGGAVNSSARANTMSHTINNGVVDTETSNGATSTVSHYNFTYGTTTSQAAADSDSFAFVTTQLTGAVIALASFKIPTVAYNDSASGIIAVGGSRSEEYIIPTAYDAIVDVDNPISHWKLGNSSVASDRKNVRNLPAVNGPIAAVSGIIGNNDNNQANQFVGTVNQYFGVNDTAGFGTPYEGSAFSIEAWAKPVVDNYGVLVSRAVSNLSIVQFGTGTVQILFAFENSVAEQFSIFSPTPITVGTVFHAVGTYDGTTAILYVNGVEVKRSTSVGVGGMRSYPNTPPQISNTYAGFWPQAVIDEVAWYNGVLSPTRVLAHYQAGVPETIYNDSRTGTIAVSGTGIESNNVDDISIGTITVSGISVEVNRILTPYDLVIDADLPISHWKLGEVIQATDRKGLTNLPVINGPVASISTLLRNNDSDPASSFDPALDQRFALTGTEATGRGIPYDTPIWSLEAWVKPTALPSLLSYILHRQAPGADKTFQITTSGVIQARLSAILGTDLFLVTATLNRIYHIVATYDGVTLIGYVNGAEKSRFATTGVTPAAPDTPFTIGNHPAVNGRGFPGVIDEVAIYDTALSAARVFTHYQAGMPDDAGRGIFTVSGTGIENYQIPGIGDSASGTVTASGSGTDQRIYNDSAFGTITASGSGTESYSYADSNAGTVTASGSGTEFYIYADSNAGTVTASGSGTDSWTISAVYNDSGSGTNIISGISTEASSANDTSTGTITAGGTSTETFFVSDTSTGTVAISGTKTETFSISDSGIGAITVSGTSTETFTVSDTGTGTITVSGTRVEAYSYTDTGTSTITASGSSTESYDVIIIYTDANSGTVTVSGTATEVYSYTDTNTGIVTVSGSRAETFSASDTSSGTVTVSGTRTEAYIYTDTGTGTIAVSGTGTEDVAYVATGTGITVTAGSSVESALYTDSITGTAIASGTSVETSVRSSSATGTIVVDGTGIDSKVYPDAGSGTSLISGTGVETHDILIGYIDSSSGQINVNGISVESQSHTSTEIGSMLADGTIVESQSHASTAIGSLLVDGTSIESQSYTNSAIGSLLVDGTSVESQSHTNTATGSMLVGGDSSESQSHTSTEIGSEFANGYSIESQSHTNTATGFLFVDGTASESYQIIYPDISDGTVTSTGTGVESASYSYSATGTITSIGEGVDEVSYSNTATGTITLLGSSIEGYSYTDISTGVVVLTGIGHEVASYTQPIPFSTVIALNRFDVKVWNKTPIQSVVTNTIPIGVQVTLQHNIKTNVATRNGMKVLVTNR